MADPHLIDMLTNSPESWNAWRWKNWDHEADLTNIDLSRKKFPREMNLRKTDFSGSNLASLFVPSANFYEAKFVGANLSHLDAVNSDFQSCNASHADFTSSLLLSTDFSSANLSNAKLVGARMSQSKFWSANLSEADLTDSDMQWVDMMDAELVGAKLIRTNLALTRFLRTNLCGATLTECNVHGTSAWRVKTDFQTTQTELIITDPADPPLRVDDLEVAQFIFLLMNHSKLRNAIDSVTKKGVLLLGRFGDGGLSILQAIAAELRNNGYLPFIFDFECPADRNLTETVKTLVGISRFVVVDLSGPSVPQELYATVPHFKIPVVPILESDRKKNAMVNDILEYPWVVKPILRFKSINVLRTNIVSKVIAPAEKILASRRKYKLG